MSKAEAFWRTHVVASSRSGSRLASYAEEHGLNVSTLRWWRSRLREEINASGESTSASDPSSSRFVAVGVMRAVEPEPIGATVKIGERVSVELTTMPSPHWLAQVVRTLQEVG